MPYIPQKDRATLWQGDYEKRWSIPAEGSRQLSAGELNFLITRLCQHFLNTSPRDYDAHNSVIGVLECAKLELYRRMVAPYEDKKREENGDVY